MSRSVKLSLPTGPVGLPGNLVTPPSVRIETADRRTLPIVTSAMPTSSASRAIIRAARSNMNLPEKPLTDAEVDALYGLEPVIGGDAGHSGQRSLAASSRASPAPIAAKHSRLASDASAGLCSYVEDCQVCCQPIEMELRVDENGAFSELAVAARRRVDVRKA